MMRFSSTLLAGVNVLVLAACSAPTSTPQASPAPASNPISSAVQTATDTAKTTTEKAKGSVEKAADVMGLKTELSGLQSSISQLTTAVTAGDFGKAKEEFATLQGSWAKAKDTLKTKSVDTSKQVDSQLGTIETLLKATKPDKAKLLTSLKNLNKTLGDYMTKL